jgi:hypothetical protein
VEVTCQHSSTAKWKNKREAVFDIKFDNPISLSQNEEPDKLVIVFWNMDLWTSNSKGRKL